MKQTKLNPHSGGRHDRHHQQAPHGNMDRHAEQQNRKFQVHICRCANRRDTRRNTKPQAETQIQIDYP